MLVALTGASGFVGSRAAEALNKAGHTVRALVRSTSRRDHIEPWVTEWRVGDFFDPQAAAGLVAGVDAVIHNAADWEALRRSATTNFERNVMGSLRLLEAARLAGAGQFIFVSSVAVHHKIINEPNPAITETHPTWPGSIYGAYKASIEPHLMAYHAEFGMNTSAWRPAAIYGIDPDLNRCQWHDLIVQARDGGAIDTDKGGKITHVDDVADALACAVGDGQVAGRLFNLIDGYIAWRRVAEIAKELTGSSATIDTSKPVGAKNAFDCAAAKAFFDRHGKPVALRRGEAGVRDYVGRLLKAMGN